MHNCKVSRNSFIDLALDEIAPAKSTELLAELDNCPACTAAYAALRGTLHVSNQALRSTSPAEDFWPGYRTRLHSKLLAAPDQRRENGLEFTQLARLTFGSQLWLALRTMTTTSLRVPVPAALAVMLLFGVTFFILRARGQANPARSNQVAAVEIRTVQVPVVQERVSTRVVYIVKRGRRARSGVSPADRTETPTASTAASSSSNSSAGTALSLQGFKPTDEVKLTIIKGSYKDQKR